MDYSTIVISVSVVIVGGILTKKVLSKKVTSTRSLDNINSNIISNNNLSSTDIFLNKNRQTVPLIEIIELSHDTKLFRFGLPSSDCILGLPVGKHFKIYCPNKVGVVPGEWNGRKDPEADKKEIQRNYTPTSSDDDRGYFDLVIKIYKGGIIDRFPDGGKASQYLDSLKIGDKIEMAGPFGLVHYKGNGIIDYKRKSIHVKHLGLIAGGTGITPMLQVINDILKHPEDKTTLSLLYANQTESDILLRDTLEDLQSKYPQQFKIWYTLDRPGDNWEYSKGFINEEMIKDNLPKPSDDTVVLMCGPPPMIKFACLPNLEKLGYDTDKLISF